jgi:hypothetical protein
MSQYKNVCEKLQTHGMRSLSTEQEFKENKLITLSTLPELQDRPYQGNINQEIRR